MPSKTELDVIAFLGEELDIPPEKISIWHRLRQDLRLDGDTANEVLLNYGYAFHVDIDAFRMGDYFHPGNEPPAPLNPALEFLLSVFGNARRLKTITVRDLVNGAESGRLQVRHKGLKEALLWP